MLTIILARLRSIRFLPGLGLAIVAIPLAYTANFLRLCGLFFLMSGFGAAFDPWEHYTDLITGGIWFFLTVLVMASIVQRFSRTSQRVKSH